MREETRTFFFSSSFSIALISCCGESKCQGAPGLCPQAPTTPSLLPLICISASPHHYHPSLVQLKVGLVPPPFSFPPSLPPHHHSFLVKLTSNSCSSPRCFLSRCFAHTHTHTNPSPPTTVLSPPAATFSFLSFNTNCGSKCFHFTTARCSFFISSQCRGMPRCVLF